VQVRRKLLLPQLGRQINPKVRKESGPPDRQVPKSERCGTVRTRLCDNKGNSRRDPGHEECGHENFVGSWTRLRENTRRLTKCRTARRMSLCATRRTNETEKLLPAILLLWLCRTTAGMSTVADALAQVLALERSKLFQSESEPKRSRSFRQKKADARKSSIAAPASPFFVWGVCGTRNRGPTWCRPCRSWTSESSALDDDGDAQTLVSLEYTLLHMI